MTPIRAFVGHSFTDEDTDVVRKFTKLLDQIAVLRPGFTWEHAEAAEPRVIDEKVMRLFDSKNLFIGICTKKERVITPTALSRSWISRSRLNGNQEDFNWKTSDWIIQEIGLAFGRGLQLILLVEKGVRQPGGIQGNLERIEFEREAPEKAFGKLLEMISNLSPKSALETKGETEPQASSADELDVTKAPDGADWKIPTPDWIRQDYELAFMHCIVLEDEAGAKEISGKYLATELGEQPQNHKSWEAFKEYANLLFDKGGSVSRLQEFTAENPDNAQIMTYLARIFSHFDEFEKAAVWYERAAETADDSAEKLQLIGKAACAYQEAKKDLLAEELVARMRSMCAGTDKGELEVLATERKLSEVEKNDEILIGTMERLLAVNPDDTETRFSLAYKYSLRGNSDLAALHYERIPYAKRTAVTWNNLGVAFDQIGMPAKSVDAYRKSQEMKETLAMSNLANKLIGAGFLIEAQAICDEALQIKDVHKNVGGTLERLKEVPDEEVAKETEARNKARPVSEFYREFGSGVARPTPDKLAARWQGPDCVLDLVLSRTSFSATGSYERSSTGGLWSLMIYGEGDATGKARDASIRYQIEYQGTVRGQAIVGGIVRRKEGEPVKAATLLTSGDDRTPVLMVLSEDGSELRVCEKPTGSSPRFYTLKPC